MKAAILVALNFMLLVIPSTGRAEEYKINLQSDGTEIAVVELSIGGDTATAKVDGETEYFDLKNQRWQHDDTKQWTSIAQCQLWAKQSKDKAIEDIAVIPEKRQPFVKWTYSPRFDITSKDDTLTLTSGQVDYKITAQKSDQDLTNYFRYARLNSYKKAMTLKQFPPFPELMVLDELERRKLMPTSMEILIPGVPNAPSFKMLFTRVKTN